MNNKTCPMGVICMMVMSSGHIVLEMVDLVMVTMSFGHPSFGIGGTRGLSRCCGEEDIVVDPVVVVPVVLVVAVVVVVVVIMMIVINLAGVRVVGEVLQGVHCLDHKDMSSKTPTMLIIHSLSQTDKVPQVGE